MIKKFRLFIFCLLIFESYDNWDSVSNIDDNSDQPMFMAINNGLLSVVDEGNTVLNYFKFYKKINDKFLVHLRGWLMLLAL